MELKEYKKSVKKIDRATEADIASLKPWFDLGVLEVTPERAAVTGALKIGEAVQLHNQLNRLGYVPETIRRFSNGEFVGETYFFDSGHRHHQDVCALLDQSAALCDREAQIIHR